jgi:hypothetical protein
MTSTVIDSTVFRHIFSGEPMRQVSSDEPARVQARLGLIPQRADDEIAVRSTLEIIVHCLTRNLTLRSSRNTLSTERCCVFNNPATSPISPRQKDRKPL